MLDDRKLLKRFGHLDDVLYTGILPQKGNISRLHTENVRFEAKTYVKPCDRQTFAMHGYKPPSVYKHYWNLYRKTMKGCRITAAGSFALRENTGVFSLPSYSGAIWTYWPDSEIPPLVQLAFDSVSCLNSHHFSHIILTPNNISEYYNGKMLENQRLHRSFISVHLLNRFGGFYLEPNTVARRSFVKLFRRLQGTTEGCLITQGGKYAGLIGPFRANSSITSQWLEGVLKGAISSTFVDFILEDKKLTTKLSCNDVFDRKSLIQDEAYTDYLDTSYTEAKLNGTKDQAKNSDKDIIRLYQSCCLPKERKCGRNETSGFVMMSKGFSLN